MAERRGLLVDYGGVLTSDLFASFAAFCAAEGIPPETLRERFRHDPEARALLIGIEEGRIPEAEFEDALGALLGLRERGGLIARLLAAVRPDAAMLDAVREARAAGVRTALVSNSWGTAFYDREELVARFDALVISGEEGIRKPAPRMYELAAQRIGLPPAACVFVDDLAFNLRPARELGMATVHHTTAAETIARLRELLDVELTPPR